MKIIKYTPDAAYKLRAINRTVLLQYGSKKAKKRIEKIGFGDMFQKYDLKLDI